MDQGLDKSKPPSTSYRETFRRHRKLFCVPIVLGVLAASFSLFGTGTTYTATASIWIDTAPPLPSSASPGTTGLAMSPASAAQATLNELLATRAFAASVAQASLLGKSLGNAGAIQKKAAGLLGNGQLVQNVPGGQVLQISYTGSSPAIAESVVSAVIAQLRSYTDNSTVEHGHAEVTYNRAQVKVAETAVATARSNITAYQAQHQGVTQADPTYASLITAENNAVLQLAQANTALTQVTGTSNADGLSMKIMDPPTQAIAAPLRKKKIVEVIIGGALGGVLVSFLAVVALTPVKKETWEDEIPVGGPVAADVPPADPFQPGSPAVPTALGQSVAGPVAAQRRLFLGDRRFQVGVPSAPSEDQ